VGTTAYVADGDAGLEILDVSDPARVVRLGGYDTSGGALGVQVAGTTAYVADWNAGLQILDISNPTNVIRLGGCGTGGAASSVQVVGTTAYVADYFAGLRILDVSDPANVVRIGGFGAKGDTWGAQVVGTAAYVADGQWGFAILELKTKFTQTLTFEPLADMPANAPPFALQAVATSGQDVSYRVVSGPAVITNGHWLVLTGVGTVTVRAEQPGNELFAPAVAVERTFEITAPPSLEALVRAWIAASYPEIPEAQRGPLADPDGDGAPNGLEHFFGGNPTLAEVGACRLPAGAVLTEPDGTRYWVTTFSVGPDVPDSLPWTIEQADDLTQPVWTPLPVGSIQRHGPQVRVRLPAARACQFLRLRL
jgi:hypothetical protein